GVQRVYRCSATTAGVTPRSRPPIASAVPSRPCDRPRSPRTDEAVGGWDRIADFRFSGAFPSSLHVAGCGLMGDLAAETAGRRRLMWAGVCRCWFPVWLPNLVSTANLRCLEQAGRSRRYPKTRPGLQAKPHARQPSGLPSRLAAPGWTAHLATGILSTPER